VLQLAFTHANYQILRERHLPEEAEARLISNTSSILLEERAQIGDEIRRMEDLRAQLTAQIAVNRAVLAPVRRLPTEMLAEIFVAVAADDISFQNVHSCHSIVQTCSTWRTVALATPRLW
ncbi:hypothetical protein HDZ31DRAFT_22192, partial [Schizophyllum fasciatum]